eukprot:2230904-Lingulodinium_polyedra.AAC.1
MSFFFAPCASAVAQSAPHCPSSIHASRSESVCRLEPSIEAEDSANSSPSNANSSFHIHSCTW